jgi:hypothetical protein
MLTFFPNPPGPHSVSWGQPDLQPANGCPTFGRGHSSPAHSGHLRLRSSAGRAGPSLW